MLGQVSFDVLLARECSLSSQQLKKAEEPLKSPKVHKLLNCRNCACGADSFSVRGSELIKKNIPYHAAAIFISSCPFLDMYTKRLCHIIERFHV